MIKWRAGIAICGVMLRSIMAEIEELLNRWESAGVLDPGAAARIRAWEKEQARPAAVRRNPFLAGVAWQGVVALVLGGILLGTGVILFVSAHWDQLGPGARFALVLAMASVFHLGGGAVRERFLALSTTLHAVGTIATGAAIALVGQIFNIEEHWPAAILLWAIAAVAGWAALRDQAQQALSLLLLPAWLLCELEFYTEGHIGQVCTIGRFLVVWAVFYLTMILGSKRRVVQGILFTVAAVAAPVSFGMMAEGWASYGRQSSLSFGMQFWAWAIIAGVPLAIAAFRGHWGLIPSGAAIITSIAMPWCQHIRVEHFDFGQDARSYTVTEPNLLAHLLTAAFALFVILWGMRQASRALVNLGVIYFGLAAGWFYFSNIFDKVGRSLGLIGLGVLFLAGGWGLEIARRRLLARMDRPRERVEVAQ